MQALQSPTFVEDVFGGKIVSSVTCLECNTVSHLFLIIIENSNFNFFEHLHIQCQQKCAFLCNNLTMYMYCT